MLHETFGLNTFLHTLLRDCLREEVEWAWTGDEISAISSLLFLPLFIYLSQTY